MSPASDRRSDERPDVLVVGGGPAGAAAAIVLADQGHAVTIVDRAARPGSRACGGLLTPRALAEFELLGVDRPAGQIISTIVLVSPERRLERPWPDHPGLPPVGLIADRDGLGAALLERAARAGATVVTGRTATDPIIDRGFVRGAHLIDDEGRTTTIRARYLVAADGATSRFGRSIGTFRRKDWPFVAALSAVWSPATPGRPCSEPASMEVHLGLTGRDGSFVPGLGWVLPAGGTGVRVGIGVWSTSREFGVLNGNELLTTLATTHSRRLGIDAGDPIAPPDGARVPVGGSVMPVAGPAHLVAGDAAGAANPLSAAGIESALWSGRLAGEVLAEALGSRDPTALQRYPSMIGATTGGYYKVGRLATRLAGHPAAAQAVISAVTRNRHLADAAMRIGLQHLRRTGGPETAYRIARTASRFGPAA